MKKEKINSSLIISTYNWPATLTLCLQSVLNQSVSPSEIVIADDGSGPETAALIHDFKQKTDIPVVHIWHEDNGFQLSAIRNKAIVAATHEYIIQIDGDIILHPHFIQDHLAIAEEGFFVTGSRVLLGKEISESIIAGKQTRFGYYTSGSKNFFNGLRNRFISLFLAKRYKTKGGNKYYVKGCNMAFWKADLLKVNGYDESFVGWGREDSEIAIRLINSGINKKFLKMAGIEYHIYHKEAARDREEGNTRLLQLSIDENRTRAVNGLDKYV